MRSLSSRLLVSVSLLLLVFFGATIAVLDTAFTEAGEQARRDILDGHLVALLAAAEPNDGGELALPERLREPRFERIGSGLYAELRDQDSQVLWPALMTGIRVDEIAVTSSAAARTYEEAILEMIQPGTAGGAPVE